MTREELFGHLRTDKPTYKDMIDFCTNGKIILNNELYNKYFEHSCDFEVYCGSDYDEDEEPIEVFQYFIISEQGAEMFKDFTNELVYYLTDFDMYLLGVTHFGTPWEGVPSNWKEHFEDYR